MKRLAKSLLQEYGPRWTVNRSLYSLKLKAMKKLPVLENIFEKSVEIERIDIFTFNVDGIEKFLSNLSKEEKMKIINEADEALVGRIKGFSSINLNYGNPINWNYNPITDKFVDRKSHWYNIPDFDEEVGDIKVIWEASRFKHFFILARAYMITKNEKYYLAFSEQLKSWLKDNQYSYGPNFKCGQEASLRMINTLIAYSIFYKYNLITHDDKINVEKIVKTSYKKVLSNFFYAHKCIQNNHTFSEICGLIIGAWCSNDEKSIKKAYKLLNKEIRKQFYSDGGFSQYSFNYHRFTLQIIECVLKISEKTSYSIKEKERIKESVLLLYQVQDKNGDVPNYGSNDGALIFPFTTGDYRDFKPVLNTVYTLIEGKKLYEKGNHEEELLWFANSSDFPKVALPKKSSSFKKSGFFTFRHSDGFLMTCLQEFKSRPAHMDQLHLDLWHKGTNVLCDSGTFSYASEEGKELSSTIAHNTVKLPNVEQMNKRGSFFITDWTQRKKFKKTKNKFKGTMISKNNYTHTRSIENKESSYTIKDKIKAEKDYCEFIFNTPCEVKIVSGGFELYKANQLLVFIEIEGKIEIEKSYRSLYYLNKEVTNRVIIKEYLFNKKCFKTFNIFLK